MSGALFKYQDSTLLPEQRAEDLLSRMSLEEKLGQIQGFNPLGASTEELQKNYPHGVGSVACLNVCLMYSKEQAADILRKVQEEIMELSEHHIPAIFHLETLCGAMIQQATSFQSGIGQASTWNPKLQKKMADIIRRQVRSAGITQAFAPVLDISRDSRMGRQGESYGEDPTLASAMGTAYVQGMQNEGNLKTGVIATAKHFLGYMASQGGIHAAASDIPERPLREVYAKPFQAAITEGGLKSVMNCYSAINGEPVAGSKKILTDLLRNEMGFNGFTVSDYTSIAEMIKRQKVSKNEADAGKLALMAGMDVELPAKECYNEGLLDLIKCGKLEEFFMDRAVKRILTAKFTLGLFEAPYLVDMEEAFHCERDRDIALKVAQESMVLLKNDGMLPLKRNIKKIAVIGHHAASTRALFGGYTFISMSEVFGGGRNTMAGINIDGMHDMENALGASQTARPTYPGSKVEIENSGLEAVVKEYYPGARNLLEQLREECRDTEILYSYGYSYTGNDESKHEAALQVAKEADIVILTLGGKFGWGTTCTTGEGIDSASINLPECQEKFIQKIAKLGKPAIAVHFDGRPISSDAADRHLNAIIEAWSPAEMGAEAITSVIFGDYNPGGKLPVSVAYHAGQIPVYYNHENGAGYHVGTMSAFDTYVDLPHLPRYHFGHGLSYTTFEYANLKVNKDKFDPAEILSVSVDIRNTGEVAGDEVVQLYVSDRVASMVRPVKELAGFKRISLNPGEKKTVTFTMKISQFALLDAEMNWKVEAGDMDLAVGASSCDIRLHGSFEIGSDLIVDGKTRGFFAQTRIE